MPPRMRMTIAAMLVVFLLIPALALFRELSQRSDIWWTPASLPVSLSDGADRVQVLIRGKPINSVVEAGQLRVADADNPVVSTTDVAFRFNNWDRVRAERSPLFLLYAAMIGAMAVLLFIVATGRLAYRGEVSTAAR